MLELFSVSEEVINIFGSDGKYLSFTGHMVVHSSHTYSIKQSCDVIDVKECGCSL